MNELADGWRRKRASKKHMRRLRQFWEKMWWSERGYATQYDHWCSKNRAKLNTAQKRVVFGVEE